VGAKSDPALVDLLKSVVGSARGRLPADELQATVQDVAKGYKWAPWTKIKLAHEMNEGPAWGDLKAFYSPVDPSGSKLPIPSSASYIKWVEQSPVDPLAIATTPVPPKSHSFKGLSLTGTNFTLLKDSDAKEPIKFHKLPAKGHFNSCTNEEGYLPSQCPMCRGIFEAKKTGKKTK
jgi:hypothetical protein